MPSSYGLQYHNTLSKFLKTADEVCALEYKSTGIDKNTPSNDFSANNISFLFHFASSSAAAKLIEHLVSERLHVPDQSIFAGISGLA